LLTIDRHPVNMWPAHHADLQSTYPSTSYGISAQSPSYEDESGNISDSVDCPYGCSTTFTGVRAFGDLTRHLKTKGCAARGRTRVDYVCQVLGCGRKYSRADGRKSSLSNVVPFRNLSGVVSFTTTEQLSCYREGL
jgi:hypothetical protein